MADFTSFLQSFKPSYSLLDVDPNIELLNQFAVLNQSLVETTNLNSQCFMGFSNENFFSTQQATADHQFPAGQLENFPAIFHHDEKNVMVIPEPVVSGGNDFHCLDSRKRKLAMDVSESSSGNSSPPVSESGIERKHSSGKGKKMKVNGKEDGLPKEVVHVRARRGQATDSHSLAERVRRGKINERLRRLQDIVPGCYKTMGMAVMLDEIINYVQSLHNQVEFLSMKLTEASRFHNFNSETGAIELLQRTKAYEAQKMQRLERESGSTPTQIGPIDLTFGTYPSLPYNT